MLKNNWFFVFILLFFIPLFGCKEHEIREYTINSEESLFIQAKRMNGIELNYQPKNWIAFPEFNMRSLTILIADIPTRLFDLSVVRLEGPLTPMINHINRWRKQLELDEIGESSLGLNYRAPVKVHNKMCKFVDITKNSRRMLVVVYEKENETVFIKLLGRSDILDDQLKNFEKTIQSMVIHDT